MKITYTQPKNLERTNAVFVELKEIEGHKFIEDSKNKNTLIIGREKTADITPKKFSLLLRKIIALAKQHKIKKLAIPLNEITFNRLRLSSKDLAEQIAVNFEMANFQFVQYKTRPKEGWGVVEEAYLLGPKNSSFEKGLELGTILAREVNAARVLSNTPGKDMTPELLARAAEKALKPHNVKVKILEREEMKKLGMGGVLGVAQGSQEKPKFIILEYFGKKTGRPMVFVGKGVTFDSGGLNVKTGDGMLEMNMDMSGASAVIHAIAACAKINLKKNIVGLIPAVENMPSGTSIRPGDILKSMSGTTIEVLNTDAEGRVILADALTYAKKYQPRLVVDVATLTGAAMAALGQRASAIFTKDSKLEKLFVKLGEESGEPVWPLPLWDEYEEEIKGTFGDWANVGKTRYGGAIQGAIFLYQFAKDYPWVHIDIAPRMTSVEGEYYARGALGVPVRLLVKLAETY